MLGLVFTSTNWYESYSFAFDSLLQYQQMECLKHEIIEKIFSPKSGKHEMFVLFVPSWLGVGKWTAQLFAWFVCSDLRRLILVIQFTMIFVAMIFFFCLLKIFLAIRRKKSKFIYYYTWICIQRVGMCILIFYISTSISCIKGCNFRLHSKKFLYLPTQF